MWECDYIEIKFIPCIKDKTTESFFNIMYAIKDMFSVSYNPDTNSKHGNGRQHIRLHEMFRLFILDDKCRQKCETDFFVTNRRIKNY